MTVNVAYRVDTSALHVELKPPPVHAPIEEPTANRSLILEAEQRLSQYPQADIPVEHFFAHKVYGRQVRVPAGTYAVGKIHRYPCINVISQGEVTVYSPEGLTHLKAPCTWVSPAGTKRLVYAHTDTVWANFHGTENTDLDALEAELIAPTFEALE